MRGLSKTTGVLPPCTPDTTLSGAPAQHHGFIHFRTERHMKNAIGWFEIPIDLDGNRVGLHALA